MTHWLIDSLTHKYSRLTLSPVCSLAWIANSPTLLSFEQLIYLGYFTLVFGGEVTSLGGELVEGEAVSWWQVGWWRVDQIPRRLMWSYEPMTGSPGIECCFKMAAVGQRLSGSAVSMVVVLLRTPISQIFNQGMLFLGSNHFLINAWLLCQWKRLSFFNARCSTQTNQTF